MGKWIKTPPYDFKDNYTQNNAVVEFQVHSFPTPNPSLGVIGTSLATANLPGSAYRNTIIGTHIRKPPKELHRIKPYYLVTVNADAYFVGVYMTFFSFAELSAALRISVYNKNGLTGRSSRQIYKQMGVVGVEFPALHDVSVTHSALFRGPFPILVCAEAIQTVYATGGLGQSIANNLTIWVNDITVSTMTD